MVKRRVLENRARRDLVLLGVREVEEVEIVEVEVVDEEVDMDIDALETEDPPPETGEVLDKLNWPDWARIWFVIELIRLIW